MALTPKLLAWGLPHEIEPRCGASSRRLTYPATPTTHIAQFSNRKSRDLANQGVRHNSNTPLSLSISPTMPKEVSDIKQFIEICRRKDASCTFFLLFPLPEKELSFPHSRKATQLADEMVSSILVVNSCAHKAKS